MAEKINIEIDLEGGAEVEKQLADIGKAGQQAFGDIQNAADQIDLSSATDALNNVQTAVQGAATFEKIIQGIGKVQSGFDALGNAANKMAARLTRSLGAIGVAARALGPVGIALGAVGGAFVKFGDDAADAINKLTVASAKVGQTPQQFDRLNQALGSLGIATDSIGGDLQKFKETLDQGFFPQDLSTGLGNFIAELERMPDSVQRTQLAIQTLGESLGGQVIAGLQTGAISAQNFQSALAGVTPVTQEQIAQAQQYQIALNQLSAAWTQLKTAFVPITTPIFQFLTEQVNIFRQNLIQLRLEIAFAKAVWDVFKAGVTGSDVGAAARKAAEEYKQLETQLKGTGTAADQAGTQAAQWLSVAGQAGQQAGQQIAQGMTAASQATADLANQSGQITVLAGSVQNLGQAAARSAAALAAAANAARFIANLDRPTTTPFVRPDAFASGGLLGGRGTGTSDSNLAWVSRGEHIMPARAVAQPGVLSFLEALRRSGGNLRGVLDGMGRFAMGGLVRSLPAFAAGGPVGSMSNVTIQFPGLPPVAGLRASSEVIGELQKAAALAQVRSGGRKPSRYS